MRKVYLLLLLACTGFMAAAQKNGSIKGIAWDTLAKQPIPMATISVLDKKDSSLVTFTMTDNQGRFELKGIPNGQYRLLVTHVNYHKSNTYFTIDDTNKNPDLGNIAMSDLVKTLGEVVVTNEDPPVTMVGDTVQYNAGSFKTVPNANVEQLLKRLPGVKVDKDGTVTAQGEKVSRVLVDGKEFFGNDPKIATRNLPADAVDKVQVYDRQSDQAQLTGFEDGNYEKTINLKLKKDKKKGLFGKITAGAGDKERYEGRFNVNSFKGARQLSAIGMGNNTNAEGFSFMDILSFTGALNQMKQGMGGGPVTLSVSADDAASMGLVSNSGINTAWAGGLNYNNIIGKKLDLQSNYFYNRFSPSSITRSLKQDVIPGGNTSDDRRYANNLNNNHRLNMNLLWQMDSLHSLRIIPSFSYQETKNRSQRNLSTWKTATGDMVNDGFTNNESTSKGYNFKNDLIFRKRFKRKGRTLSLTLTTSLNENDGTGDLNSIFNYYTGGSIFRRDTLNQKSTSEGDLRGYAARAIYTEPLWKKSLLELSAGRSNTVNTSSKITYDYNRLSGKFDEINELLTNDFENTYGYTTAGVRLRKQGRKYNYSVGLTWQQAELEGKIISGTKDSVISKSFRNLLPNATFRYNFTRFKYFHLMYSASTTQPTVSQLQPVPDNSNPLYIREGNPDLAQEFTHFVRGNLNLLSPFTNRNMFLNFNLQTTRNRIVNYDELDLATGVRKTRPVNVNGVYMLTGSFSYSLPVRFLKGNVELGTRTTYNKAKQFLNTQENIIRTLVVGPDVRFDINPAEKLNLMFSANYNINTARYSLSSSQDNQFFSQVYETSVQWQLPASFFFNTDFTYTVNSRRAEGFNTNIPFWTASISKQFLKYNRGELKLTATDLLNRNVNISRTANQNYIEDKEVNTLRRFFLLSFTYSLSKTGLNKAGAPVFKAIGR